MILFKNNYNGNLHRNDDKPALINGNKSWFNMNHLHRDNDFQAKIEVTEKGSILKWYII